MSIKQNGGVFGRNPTFNDVTIEGQLTFDGDIDITSDLTVDGTLKADSLRLGDIAPSYNVLSSARNAGGSFEWGHPNNSGYPSTMGAETGSGSPYIAFNAGPGTNGNTYKTLGLLGTVVKPDTAGNLRIGRLTNANADNQTPTESAVFTNSGNLQFPSGQGIDFSPTSGTGTSELLDDYEEGTWTPTYTGSTSNPTITYDIRFGIYVKVGRLCHVVCRIRTDATSGGSGNLLLSGLPFNALSAATSSMSGGITVNRADSFTTNTPTYGVISNGNSYIDLNYDIAANAVTTANLTNAVNSNTLIISLVYQTA